MRVARLVGGPLHEEEVEIPASARLIEVDLGAGRFATYAPDAGGCWRYTGDKRLPVAKATALNG